MSAKDISGKRPNRKRYSSDKDNVYEQDMNVFKRNRKVAKNYFRSFSNLTATNIRPPNNCAQKHLKDKNVAEVEEEPIEMKEEPIEMKEEPLDPKEEPIEVKEETLDIKKEPLDIKKEPLDISEEIDYRFQIGVEAFEPLDEKNRYECLICETGFAQKNLLEQHNDAVHEEKKAFKCSLCDHTMLRLDATRKKR
jgi:hypothetical protein